MYRVQHTLSGSGSDAPSQPKRRILSLAMEKMSASSLQQAAPSARSSSCARWVVFAKLRKLLQNLCKTKHFNYANYAFQVSDWIATLSCFFAASAPITVTNLERTENILSKPIDPKDLIVLKQYLGVSSTVLQAHWNLHQRVNIWMKTKTEVKAYT